MINNLRSPIMFFLGSMFVLILFIFVAWYTYGNTWIQLSQPLPEGYYLGVPDSTGNSKKRLGIKIYPGWTVEKE